MDNPPIDLGRQRMFRHFLDLTRDDFLSRLTKAITQVRNAMQTSRANKVITSTESHARISLEQDESAVVVLFDKYGDMVSVVAYQQVGPNALRLLYTLE